MGIDLSGNLFRFGINQNLLQNGKQVQSKGTGDIEPVVVSTSQNVNPDDVLSFMAASSAVNRTTLSAGVNTAPTTKSASKPAAEPTPEEILAQEAKELAQNPDLDVDATGSKTLSCEKNCTKGRNMGNNAKNLAVQYLDKEIKSQIKDKFMAKYSSVLTELGYSKSDITSKFETMYNSTKSEIAAMAQNLDKGFVTFGNKGFLNNKGWVKVDTQKLVDSFMAKFNQKAGELANEASAKAVKNLESSQAAKAEFDELCSAYEGGKITAEEFIDKLEDMGAKNIHKNKFGAIIFEIDGKEHSVIRINGITNPGDLGGVNSGDLGGLNGPQEFLYLGRLKTGFTLDDVLRIVNNNNLRDKTRVSVGDYFYVGDGMDYCTITGIEYDNKGRVVSITWE